MYGIVVAMCGDLNFSYIAEYILCTTLFQLTCAIQSGSFSHCSDIPSGLERPVPGGIYISCTDLIGETGTVHTIRRTSS